MNEDRYANCLADTRDIVLEYLYRNDPVMYEYWFSQVVGMPECVPMMVRDVLSAMQPAPVNDPSMYVKGLFE